MEAPQPIRVLILAYDFPPYVSVGGLRPWSWLKYMHRHGALPVVVTRQWSNRYGSHLDYVAPGHSDSCETEHAYGGTVIRAPYKPNAANRLLLKYGDTRYRLLRKAVSAWYEFIQFFVCTGPKASLFRAADEYLKNNPVDLILATGDPFVLFHYASKLAKRHSVPWIADYRDPWSQDIHIAEKPLIRRWSAFLERRIVRSASLITTVSDYFRVRLSELFPEIPVKVVLNGYDPEVMEAAKDIEADSGRLKIGFAGTLHPYHPLESFLKTFAVFAASCPDPVPELNFYGTNIPEEISQMISLKFPGIQKHTNIYPRMPNEQLAKELARHHLLLLFNYYSMMGTKIYDYLGLKRNILLCYTCDPEAGMLKQKFYHLPLVPGLSDNLQEELVLSTHSGYTVRDAADLKNRLESVYREFRECKALKCHTRDAEAFSRENQTKILVQLAMQIKKK